MSKDYTEKIAQILFKNYRSNLFSPVNREYIAKEINEAINGVVDQEPLKPKPIKKSVEVSESEKVTKPKEVAKTVKKPLSKLSPRSKKKKAVKPAKKVNR